MRLHLPALIAPLFLLSAVAAPIPKATEESAFYYPTKVGDKWTYTLTEKTGKDKGKKHELVEEVTAVEDKQGVKVVTVGRIHHDGKVYTHRIRRVSDQGVWQIESVGFEDHRTPWVFLKLPHKPGQTWEDDRNDKENSLAAHGPERVKVPAGEFNAIRVEWRKRGEPKSDPIHAEWYAPRVGSSKAKRRALSSR
jgi:hypothetical protein